MVDGGRDLTPTHGIVTNLSRSSMGRQNPSLMPIILVVGSATVSVPFGDMGATWSTPDGLQADLTLAINLDITGTVAGQGGPPAGSVPPTFASANDQLLCTFFAFPASRAHVPRKKSSNPSWVPDHVATSGEANFTPMVQTPTRLPVGFPVALSRRKFGLK